MKYFLDTEFIEGFHKPLFGKRRHFIDLISIGIVSEDGNELYLVSNEYNYNDADDWVKEKIILPLYISMVHGDKRNRLTVENFHKVLGISNKEIAEQVAIFCECFREQLYWRTNKETEFYAYYADYDWVLLCSLFGRMIDLPHGFPMYCKDLKQMLDEKVSKADWLYGRDCWSNKNRSIKNIGTGDHQEKDRPATFEEKLKLVKELSEFPKQKNEHNALDDARWNKKLFEFINQL